MSTCDCGDSECSICQGRSRGGKGPVLDEFMAQKAREEEARKAQLRAQAQPTAAAPAPTVAPAPAVPVVQVETPLVAQLARGWTPPAIDNPAPAASPEEVNAALQQLATAGTIQRKEQTAFAKAYTAWQQECKRRNDWIASLYMEFTKRQRERQQAIAQWDAHVAEAKLAWQQGKTTLPPPAPRKEQFAAQ